METIELKELKISEKDFTFEKFYTSMPSFGRTWEMKRYNIFPELLGITPENTLKAIYGHYYALRECGDRILVEIGVETNLDEIINDLQRYFKVWQLGKYYCGQYEAKEARDIFERYIDYFNNKEFPKDEHPSYYELQQQAAAELGLGVERICFISRQDDNLYLKGAETVYTTPEEYGRVPVYVRVDRDGGDKHKISLFFASRYDQTYLGKACNDYNERMQFEKVFDRKEPQRFSIGKLTEKKKAEWFSYIRDYTNEANRFFAERHNAVGIAEKKLKDACFERIGDSMEWQCSKGYFDCIATVGKDGRIYTDIRISSHSKVREEVFGI